MISVLTSIYNESESQIRESIESILSQTYSDIEFIIVCDNPQREDVKQILDSYHDSRMKFYQNDKNIGLAMSMNRAASVANGNIFARMDADDIALPDRFKKEIAILESGNYDIVFSQYFHIDENSSKLDYPLQQVIMDGDSTKVISLNPSVIHHPTVMFTRQIFEKSGGYRDFPCSQDADLWLRMIEHGGRFHMLAEPLLYYRINPNSVSSKKWFRQQLTCAYIFEISIERLKKGKDSYTKDNYEWYLREWGLGDAAAEAKLRNNYNNLRKAICLKREGKYAKAILTRFGVFVSSSIMRRHYLKLKEKNRLINKRNNKTSGI